MAKNNALFEHVLNRLKKFGVEGHVEGQRLHIGYKNVSHYFNAESGQEAEFVKYREIVGAYFNDADYTFEYGSELEVPLAILNGAPFRDDEFVFSSAGHGHQVCVRRANLQYALAFFDSDSYDAYFHTFVTQRLSRAVGWARSLNSLFRFPITATYTSLLALSSTELKEKGLIRIRACLLKLAIEQHLCLDVSSTYVRADVTGDTPKMSDGLMPNVTYDRNLGNFYMVGRSSPFPSQSYLAYYHILEYFFLRVSESILHDRLKALLNAPSFQSSSDGVDKAIAMVSKHQNKNDEVEMLRNVLEKFVSEGDFIAFVRDLEAKGLSGEYSKKHTVFGESFDISLREGHAISNAAKLLKHIRNAIVHSSDRYSRDDCHVPLTESEAVIRRYVPIVKYFAEQVLYGTASPIGS
jgi:hypothetical protein